MSKWALIVDGTVVETTEIDPVGRFHPSLNWQECAADAAPGWRYAEGQFVAPELPPVADLAAIKITLKAAIDAQAETERLKYITPGHGQAMTYRQKVAEAQAFKAASNPQTADYPVLSSEVGITATTLGEVADIVLTAFAQWQQIGAAIEAVRLAAKRDIDAAEDEAAARAVVALWPQIAP